MPSGALQAKGFTNKQIGDRTFNKNAPSSPVMHRQYLSPNKNKKMIDRSWTSTSANSGQRRKYKDIN